MMVVTTSWVLGKHLDDWEWHHGFSSSSTRDRKKRKTQNLPQMGSSAPHFRGLQCKYLFEVAIPQ